MNGDCNDQGCIVTMKSSPVEKIRLMSLMFYGRRDVFARRYERKDGRGGYAPLCSNEWVRGVCGKCARVRHDCATCAARDFMPISDKVFEWHLRGVDDKGKPFTMGVYPMLEAVTNVFTGKYILGLSATPVRRDGLLPIIQMQCGSLRHRVEPKRMAVMR